MARLSLIFGFLLIALGVVAFLTSNAIPKPVTALIPAIVGVILVLLSAIARKSPSVNKHAMHVAALLTLIGAAGGLGMGIPNIIKYAQGNEAAALKALTQGGMGILCLVFLVLCVRSFIAARKSRLQA